MYAISPANTNGSSTSWPRIRISTTNSGNPQRVKNRRSAPLSPNQVCDRLRATAPEIGCVIAALPGSVPTDPIDGSLGRCAPPDSGSPDGSPEGSIGVTAPV